MDNKPDLFDVSVSQAQADTLFDTIRNGRATESGKACVDIARAIFGMGLGGAMSERRSGEARQWVNMGLKCDNATTAERVVEIQEKLKKRLDRKALTSGLKAVDGGAA